MLDRRILGLMAMLVACGCNRQSSSASGPPEPEATPAAVLPPAQQAKPGTPGPVATPAAGLDASKLVSAADLANWLPVGVSATPLPGAPRSASYDGIKWVAGAADFGLAVQWWRFRTADEAASRFDKNLKGAPGAQVGSEVGSRSFVAPAYKHHEVVFLDSDTNSVVEISCGDQTCAGEPGAAHLMALAKAISSRLVKS
jgi:hypothetical protein